MFLAKGNQALFAGPILVMARDYEKYDLYFSVIVYEDDYINKWNKFRRIFDVKILNTLIETLETHI